MPDSRIKSFLGKEYQSLLLVDLICHGVPSLSFLKQHIQTIIGNKKVKGVVFREDNEYILSLIAPDQSILYRSDLWKIDLKIFIIILLSTVLPLEVVVIHAHMPPPKEYQTLPLVILGNR